MENKIDARKLPHEVLEEKRRQAHSLRKRGMTRAEIGEIVGVHADTVGRWLKLGQKNRGGMRGYPRGDLPELPDCLLVNDQQVDILGVLHSRRDLSQPGNQPWESHCAATPKKLKPQTTPPGMAGRWVRFFSSYF